MGGTFKGKEVILLEMSDERKNTTTAGYQDSIVPRSVSFMQSLFVHVLEHVHCRLTKSTQYVKKVEALRGQHGGHLQGQEEVILL